ncbi:MAG: leucine-rich repeat protein, partial [Clostridia bacterium]|nr:leucine-rich repeat protein [Clostridia bacterium]
RHNHQQDNAEDHLEGALQEPPRPHGTRFPAVCAEGLLLCAGGHHNALQAGRAHDLHYRGAVGGGSRGISCPESVISIGDYAFDCCYGLTSVTNPDSVTSIGKEAFRSCFNLKNITIGKSVTSIGDYAFWNCESIKVIDIPDSVTSIGDGAFKDCTSLTTVIIGNGVTSIGEETFFYCDRLTSITIGNGVKSIGDWAFYDCTELTEITIPKSVTCIGDIAFGRCTGLTSVTIPDSVTSIGDQAFYWCIGLTSVNIPNGVTDIGDYAFFNCGSLIDIVIPDSVESIGEYAFSDCYSLSSVKIPDSVEYIGEHAFEGVMNIIYNAEKMTAAGSPWGARNVDAYHEDNLWYYDKTKKVLTGCDVTAGNLVEVPGSVMEVDSEVFLNCDRVRTVDFKSENIAFCEDAFGGCPNLETVVTKNNTVDGITYSIAPDRQTRKLSSGKLSSDKNVNEEIRIKKDTEISFCNRDREDDYVVPDNIVSIGKNAFSNCTEVTVTIPDSVKLRHIGKDAFKNNKNYRNWNNNDALLINDYVVAAFRGLSSMAFSASVKGIADYVFESFASLCDISFGSGSKLEFIGKGAFSGCESLSTVRLPKNLKILGTGAFENTAITTAAEKPVVNGTTLVYVPENTESFTFKGEYKDITCIADGAFKNCSELKEIIIPETIISIGERTFEGCTSLNKITLPKSLNEIGKFAFKDCINLTSVDIPENVDTIADEENLAFYGCSGLEAINVAPENKYFSSDKGILMNKAGDTIINFPAENMTRDSNNKDYTVPGTIKEIKSFAFRRCKVIGNIYVKNGVGLGNRNPFEGFKGLFGRYDTGVDGIPVSDTLYSDSNETDIAGVSTSVKGTYTVPDQVTSIGANAFVDCKEITEVIFPARLAVIGDEAFKDCSRLKKVTFYAPEDGSRNENMKDIGTDAFKGCPVKECNYEVLNEKLQKIMKIYIEQGADESKIKFSAPSGTITNVKYNQPAKIIASATGLPKGYKLAIYEGDSQKKAVTADDKGEATVELETGAITSDRTFTVKVLDASGNEVDGKSKTVTIDVDDGFFAK